MIAKSKKPFTVGEELVHPEAVKIAEIVFGSAHALEVKKIPLSNDTIARRISEICENQLQQLIDRVKNSPRFAIQLDESTNITNAAQLMVFIRYAHGNNMLKDMLFCQTLEGQTTGNDIFIKVDAFFKRVGFSWDNCIGVCTDSAAAVTGKNIGFQSKVKSATNTSVTFTHCMIHREALVAKKMSTDLHEVLSVAIKIINYIKSNALNSRLFRNLCQDMNSEY